MDSIGSAESSAHECEDQGPTCSAEMYMDSGEDRRTTGSVSTEMEIESGLEGDTEEQLHPHPTSSMQHEFTELEQPTPMAPSDSSAQMPDACSSRHTESLGDPDDDSANPTGRSTSGTAQLPPDHHAQLAGVLHTVSTFERYLNDEITHSTRRDVSEEAREQDGSPESECGIGDPNLTPGPGHHRKSSIASTATLSHPETPRVSSDSPERRYGGLGVVNSETPPTSTGLPTPSLSPKPGSFCTKSPCTLPSDRIDTESEVPFLEGSFGHPMASEVIRPSNPSEIRSEKPTHAKHAGKRPPRVLLPPTPVLEPTTLPELRDSKRRKLLNRTPAGTVAAYDGQEEYESGISDSEL